MAICRYQTLIFLTLIIFSTTVYADTTVEVTGYGITSQQATKDALRGAVEQGIGVKIFSESVVKDFVAVKDVIISESFGMVTGYKVLSKKNMGRVQGWEVHISATVSKDVGKKWAEMKIILEQKGSPSVMFCLKETLDGQETPNNTGEIRLVNKFKELGFKVINRKISEETRELQKQIYAMDQDHKGIVAIASKHGADLVVIGLLEGTFKGYQDFYGINMIEHNYLFGTQVVRTDTAEVVGATTKSYYKRLPGHGYSRESAGRAGFARVVGSKFIDPMMVDILKTWIRDVQEGVEITLVVSNVKFKMRKQVIATLEDLPDLITAVRINHYRKKRLELRVKSKLNTEELAGELEEIEGLPLEVQELKKNWLEVEYVGN